MKLRIEPTRENNLAYESTSIFIRAINSEGKWDSVDIAQLDKPSLLFWLKSRGGDNPWAEDVVGILLGHGHLHD
ncbi:hypothetical protein KAR91_35665 [Candidatus Pacearchaeota archaeon]|nr:hypothetical protein [Candidatus Pacearchaeota archaeon]